MSAAHSETVFVSTTPGLEPALEAEARALDPRARAVPGGVELAGGSGLHQEACLQLRTASHVLLRITEGDAGDSAEVREALARISLRPFVTKPPSVEVSVRGSALSSSAVEAAARAAWGRGEGERLLVRVEGRRFTVSIDCAGELLHRRGYRQEVSRAPMRETLAAGVLLLGGYSGEVPLWDPMCGSGTLLIEAALIARRRPPGLGRSFAFEGWPSFDAAAWTARQQAAARTERPPPQPIFGTDLNAGSLGVARRNARRAGVLEDLKLERRDALTLTAPSGLPPGVVVANLPYGKRVGGGEDLIAFHRAFGAALRKGFAGWRAVLLVGGDRYADALELAVSERWPVDNGGLRCGVVVCELR